jgi:RimJ/RimL family protein N-acetyltransferase
MQQLKHQYTAIRPLMAEAGPHLALVSEAMIAGNSPAAIWVDNVDAPCTAVLWDTTHSVYLIGDADCVALDDFVKEYLLPQASDKRLGILKLYYDDPQWQARIPHLFRGVELIERERAFFTLRQPAVGAPAVPEGFRIQAITPTLLASPSLRNAEFVIEEILACWPSLERFWQNGFGFCLIGDEEEIACRCTAEYVSGDQCGIGIETLEAYQGRGFATVTTAAFVEHCHHSGIRPYWDSWAANVPSVRVAEKVGFERAVSYRVFVAVLN